MNRIWIEYESETEYEPDVIPEKFKDFINILKNKLGIEITGIVLHVCYAILVWQVVVYRVQGLS
jgi:hypothetical protein